MEALKVGNEPADSACRQRVCSERVKGLRLPPHCWSRPIGVEGCGLATPLPTYTHIRRSKQHCKAS